jgi:dihydroneopterin aldolase
LELDGSADETDHISDTVDYGAAAAIVTAAAQGHRYRTFEKLARVLAERLLLEYTPVQAVTITVVKRLPPAAIIADEAGVRMTLRR